MTWENDNGVYQVVLISEHWLLFVDWFVLLEIKHSTIYPLFFNGHL